MVPFGLAQAPTYFQLLKNKVLEGLSYAMTYLDDIIIFSKNEEDHLRHLEEVFCQLRKAGRNARSVTSSKVKFTT